MTTRGCFPVQQMDLSRRNRLAKMIRFTELNTRGWTCVTGSSSRSALLELARSIGRPVPSPSGELVRELAPKPPAAAGRGTLSKAYGMGAFPLHTDTAFWPVPARYVVLLASGDIRRYTSVLTFTDLFLGSTDDLP